MAAGNERITLAGVIARLVRKLREPGAVAALNIALHAQADACNSIGLQLEQRAAEMPEGVALKFEGRRWTWRELNAWVNRWSHALTACGVGEGDVVAIHFANRPALLAAVYATVKLGAVAALVNTAQRGAVLAHSLGLVRPRVIVAGAEQVEALASLSAPPEATLLWVGNGDAAAPPPGYLSLDEIAARLPQDNPPSTATVRLRRPCFYIFTSGTTGLPKASVMTHLRWYKTAVGFGRLALGLSPDDTLYCCLPFYHNNALTIAAGGSLVSGAALAMSRRFSATRFWDEVRESGATAFCYIGELLRYLLLQPASAGERSHDVRRILGNGLRPELWDDCKRRFGIDRVYEFYGLSEGTNGFVNLFNYDRSCGWSPGDWAIVRYDVDSEVPLRQADGRMQKLGRGQVGLLLTAVNDQRPFDGYTTPQAGESRLLRDVFRRGDCWLNTGDLMRSQGWGHAQFVDRLGDSFRWQGENVATTEVEAVIQQWPSIAEAVVYGVRVPGRDGRCGMVSLTSVPGASLDLDRLAQHLRASLPKYAVPRFLRLTQNATITDTFKHRKAELRRQAYDIAQFSDPVYYLAPNADCCVALTPELRGAIDRGDLAL